MDLFLATLRSCTTARLKETVVEEVVMQERGGGEKGDADKVITGNGGVS